MGALVTNGTPARLVVDPATGDSVGHRRPDASKPLSSATRLLLDGNQPLFDSYSGFDESENFISYGAPSVFSGMMFSTTLSSGAEREPGRRR